MKWTPDADGYATEAGIYRARVNRCYSMTAVPIAGSLDSIAVVSRRPDGWIWRVSKDGKPWKKGTARLLKDCKRRAEDVITAALLEATNG